MASTIDNKIRFFFVFSLSLSARTGNLVEFLHKHICYLEFNPVRVENSKVQLLLFPNDILKFSANGKIFNIYIHFSHWPDTSVGTTMNLHYLFAM